MSHLQQNVQSSELLLGKLKNLLKFLKFTDLLMKFIIKAADTERVDDYKFYFVKNIILFLVSEVSEDRIIPNDVKIRILQHILDYIKRTIVHCTRLYKDNLNQIIGKLVDLALFNKTDFPLCEEIAEIFKYFFVDSRQLLGDTLGMVDIVPEDHPAFEHVSSVQHGYARDTLCKEIERFLMVPMRSVHSMKYLRKRIHDNEKEFIELFKSQNQPEIRNISNTESLSHRFVVALLKCVKDGNPAMQNEATKILGDIGPMDLNTMILNRIGYSADLIKCVSVL